ncbi:sulfate transporter family-domain-containing protein [Hypoxylon fragiforme]|uniref:sulfate transporter family-domain-containing protein n=1 Tax=Hypoxylon fragiforme TaxID=63214 RepID=UPI0020C71E4C|nr:sulfate transporter family-domain-containing protein [Hypoxylon fragiforme]KAI2614627.1 sulfate transporter family-domain-containing protein [Hypoxylon fragiforme]
MATPSFGFSSWRRRSSSVASRSDPVDVPDQIDNPDQTSLLAVGDSRPLSSSLTSHSYREPTRSFVPGSVRDHLSPLDSASFARSVREDTAELASYVLSDKKDRRSTSFLNRISSTTSQQSRDQLNPNHESLSMGESQTTGTDTIDEVSEPSSPPAGTEDTDSGPSALTTMLKRSPPQSLNEPGLSGDSLPSKNTSSMGLPQTQLEDGSSETTPLLGAISRRPESPDTITDIDDLESQKPNIAPWGPSTMILNGGIRGTLHSIKGLANPKTWDRKVVWQRAVVDPVRCLPAVVVGLLLNILDALSYGMILFPLGNPIFADLGPAGISIFYVSTIISQLTFSFGSLFRGGIGSELIEVVPFFHNMATTITATVGEDQPDAVIATTITSFAISSMLTGVVFYLMGRFKLGYIVGFIPRHILIGCIGGVGWFLIATGLEVSARLEEFNYDLDTGRRLIQTDTLPLWLIPLSLAIILFGLQRKITSKYFLPIYILCVPVFFYFFVFTIDSLDTESLREGGWIFKAPEAGQPWWYFWTLYKFNLVHWGAVLETSGAMFALTFFSVLHVPINVPALAQISGEDNLDLDHELKLHGYSNFISGLAGSIQNYLVFANTLFFMRSGGDSRLAGILLAALTFVVMTIGPVTIGYIPVMVVGTLIFVLGFELLLDALISPRRKLKLLEYLTIVVIVLTMGIYDFVVGIFVGIILAFVSAIFHASQVSAIRATYTGDQVGSMVRRNPSQHHFLQDVGSQTYVIKLSGFLFFGTIVGVEEKIRSLISDNIFREHPIKYLILDLWHVTGIDYSAAEAFKTISRLLNGKGVHLLLSGKDAESRIGRDLRAVGLGADELDVMFMPDLNSALESCENEQLKTFYARQEALRISRPTASSNLDVPNKGQFSQSLEFLSQSPRRNHLDQAARTVLNQQEFKRSTRWQNIKEPLRLMLQVFYGLSNGNEDFWFRAKPYFIRKEFSAGTVLYQRGESARGFYLLERGELRADYETPQGRLSEPIVQGTTCGELPFFSETNRTATVVAVKDCVAWVMDTENWEKLQKEEGEVAQELLRISLKLTSERMDAMTKYISAVGN